MRVFFDLTKFGIVIFVILSAMAGYLLSYTIETPFSLIHFVKTLLGVYLLSSGSLALNQVQELEKDRKMPRTSKRPIVNGKIKPLAAAILALSFICGGFYLLFEISPMAGWLGAATILLYNFIYTYIWKPKWVFAAVPGAIPGALPVTIGFAANSPDILRPDSLYLFGILFFWQMPHFWALAIKYRKDYAAANVPTLPVALGVERSLFHIGIYTFCYVGLALLMPVFFHASWAYLFLVVPVSYFVMVEYFKFLRSNGEQRWFAFFMWTNISVLVYQLVPIFDRWSFVILGRT